VGKVFLIIQTWLQIVAVDDCSTMSRISWQRNHCCRHTARAVDSKFCFFQSSTVTELHRAVLGVFKTMLLAIATVIKGGGFRAEQTCFSERSSPYLHASVCNEVTEIHGCLLQRSQWMASCMGCKEVLWSLSHSRGDSSRSHPGRHKLTWI
jgi:hypothetical protein